MVEAVVENQKKKKLEIRLKKIFYLNFLLILIQSIQLKDLGNWKVQKVLEKVANMI